MRHRRKKTNGARLYDPGPDEASTSETLVRPVLIIGAGVFLHDILTLLKKCPGFDAVGILDPDTSLKGQCINGIPVIGWLGDVTTENASSAIIGTSASPGAFDREAVFHILFKRGFQLPILSDPDSKCASDVALQQSTIQLTGSTVESGAIIGKNCLIGSGAHVRRGVCMDDHTVLMPKSELKPGAHPAQHIRPKSLDATLAGENDTIQEIIRRINWSQMEIMLIVDSTGQLKGTITDGDIRRGILAGIELHQPVSSIMNPNPTTVPLGTSHKDMLNIMQRLSIRHLPVVDNIRRPVRLEMINDLLDDKIGQEAVIMAGGLGARLRPLTYKTPKPLLPIAGKPILDHILSGLSEAGIKDIVISVNHLANQIKNHVGDGNKHNLNVAYLAERNRLGTAGALSLLRPRPKQPFLVMNGDLLTNMDFSKLLRFQKKETYSIVMCLRKLEFHVPYGVVELHDGEVVALHEKPTYKHFINAGIYVLDPSCIELIPANRFFDMTDLIKAAMARGDSVGAFPIIEYWRDIGTPNDLKAIAQEHNMITRQTADSPNGGEIALKASA